MPEQIQEQQIQGPEGPGMAKTFTENPSMEILRERRIDQMVAKKEAERAKIAQGMQNAEARGINSGRKEGYKIGAQHGFGAGHQTGLESGFRQGYNAGGQNQLGLGSLPKMQSKEPDMVVEDYVEGGVGESQVN